MPKMLISESGKALVSATGKLADKDCCCGCPLTCKACDDSDSPACGIFSCHVKIDQEEIDAGGFSGDFMTLLDSAGPGDPGMTWLGVYYDYDANQWVLYTADDDEVRVDQDAAELTKRHCLTIWATQIYPADSENCHITARLCVDGAFSSVLLKAAPFATSLNLLLAGSFFPSTMSKHEVCGVRVAFNYECDPGFVDLTFPPFPWDSFTGSGITQNALGTLLIDDPTNANNYAQSVIGGSSVIGSCVRLELDNASAERTKCGFPRTTPDWPDDDPEVHYYLTAVVSGSIDETCSTGCGIEPESDPPVYIPLSYSLTLDETYTAFWTGSIFPYCGISCVGASSETFGCDEETIDYAPDCVWCGGLPCGGNCEAYPPWSSEHGCQTGPTCESEYSLESESATYSIDGPSFVTGGGTTTTDFSDEYTTLDLIGDALDEAVFPGTFLGVQNTASIYLDEYNAHVAAEGVKFKFTLDCAKGVAQTVHWTVRETFPDESTEDTDYSVVIPAGETESTEQDLGFPDITTWLPGPCTTLFCVWGIERTIIDWYVDWT